MNKIIERKLSKYKTGLLIIAQPTLPTSGLALLCITDSTATTNHTHSPTNQV